MNKIFNCDCIEGMKKLADNSVDMILCDPPYQLTEFSWDKSLNLENLFSECCRVLKPCRCIALFAVEPFASKLRTCKPDWYKYDWIWIKNKAANYQNAKCAPLRIYENILIFSDGKTSPGNANNMLYNPQGVIEITPCVKESHDIHFGRKTYRQKLGSEYVQTQKNYPKNILNFSIPNNKERLHSTQKPVDLLEYLIKTYSNVGEVVLDFTCGSGSTCVAAVNTDRQFIGIELDEHYFEVACDRVAKAMQSKAQPKLFEDIGNEK